MQPYGTGDAILSKDHWHQFSTISSQQQSNCMGKTHWRKISTKQANIVQLLPNQFNLLYLHFLRTFQSYITRIHDMHQQFPLNKLVLNKSLLLAESRKPPTLIHRTTPFWLGLHILSLSLLRHHPRHLTVELYWVNLMTPPFMILDS